jgi:hypothetical protein
MKNIPENNHKFNSLARGCLIYLYVAIVVRFSWEGIVALPEMVNIWFMNNPMSNPNVPGHWVKDIIKNMQSSGLVEMSHLTLNGEKAVILWDGWMHSWNPLLAH